MCSWSKSVAETMENECFKEKHQEQSRKTIILQAFLLLFHVCLEGFYRQSHYSTEFWCSEYFPLLVWAYLVSLRSSGPVHFISLVQYSKKLHSREDFSDSSENFSSKIWVFVSCFFVRSGGFKKVREAQRNHFQLISRKSDLMVPSYD